VRACLCQFSTVLCYPGVVYFLLLLVHLDVCVCVRACVRACVCLLIDTGVMVIFIYFYFISGHIYYRYIIVMLCVATCTV